MRTTRFARVLLLLLAAGSRAPAGASTLIPAPPQSGPIAITGATVHPVSGPAIANGTVLFDRGLIVAVGANVVPPAGTRIVDATGKHVYPGLIAAYSTMGLHEIDQARATDDLTEVGDINPNTRAEVAYNPDSEHIPVTRSNGILTAVVAPRGGLISGRAAIMRMDGWTWEDLVIKAPAALQVAWPAISAPEPGWDEKKKKEVETKHAESLEKLRNAFGNARAYLRAKEAAGTKGLPPHDRDQRWEAMIPVLRGEIPVLLIANTDREIAEGIAWALGEKVRVILAGAGEAERVIDLLRKNDIPVIVANVLREPLTRDAAYDEPYTLAAQLHTAGIRFAIGSVGAIAPSDAPASWALRNLPYEAAMAAAYGLPADEALKAITLYPAQMYGIADRLGTLEPGRSATLFIANGDILEIPTQVEAAYIDGRPLDLEDRHKMLYRKYQEKYRQLGLIR